MKMSKHEKALRERLAALQLELLEVNTRGKQLESHIGLLEDILLKSKGEEE